jgi:hypothetical protein
MTQSTAVDLSSAGQTDAEAQTPACDRASAALLALRTKYGLTTVNAEAMDRITALQVAATLEFLSNNLPQNA